MPVGDSRGGGREPCEQVSEVDGIQHREREETPPGDVGRMLVPRWRMRRKD